MSFFNKISDQFDNLNLGSKNESDQSRNYGYPDQGGQQPPPGQYSQGSPPMPSYQPPPGKAPLPQGWVAQFDQQHLRWYYAETSTGRTQWEAPGQPQPPPPMRGEMGYEARDDQKKGGKGGMLMGAAGGLAVGAIGGAVISHALHDSDSSDDEHQQHYQQGGNYSAPPPPMPPSNYGGYGSGGGFGGFGGHGGGGGEYGEENYDGGYDQGPPAVLPPTDADGNSVSSSDREEVQEARDEYEEEQAEANDSDASSSDREEAQEAYEEYEEEYEEVYEE